MRPLRNRPDTDGEILFAGIAVIVVFAGFSFFDVFALAIPAHYAVFPQNPSKVVDG